MPIAKSFFLRRDPHIARCGRERNLQCARALRQSEYTMRETNSSPIARVVERNIEALLQRQEREQRARGVQDRLADGITRFTGSLPFIYVHLAVVLAWTLINAGVTPLPKFDPTFVLLATFASVEAIFLTAFVLMTQNRMQAEADRRADLDLQISLLTEHELTRLVSLTRRLAERAGIDSDDTELQAIQRDVAPDEVLDALERKQHEFRSKVPPQQTM
jgi:uncharacterized membrane protein